MKLIACTISAIVMASSGHATLISDVTGQLWDYDVTNNSRTLIGNSGYTMFDIALNPLTNTLYGFNYNSNVGKLFEIDQSDASVTLIGETDKYINGLTFGSDGTLYGSGHNGLYSLDTTTGSTNLIGYGDYFSSGDIAFDDSGNLFLASIKFIPEGSAEIGNGDELWKIDTATGAGSLIGATGYRGLYGLNYLNDTLYGFTDSGLTLAIDTLTGSGTELFPGSYGIYHAYGADGAGGITTVVEPSAFILLAIGLFGVGVSRSRSKPKPANV